MITFTQQSDSQWFAVFDNGVLLGDAVREVDGYFYFWFDRSGGFLPAWVLREIAEFLDLINAEWDAVVALLQTTP